MAIDAAAFKAHRAKVMEQHGQWVGIFDKDMNYVMDVEDWVDASWPAAFSDVGSMSMTLEGSIVNGDGFEVMNPAVEYLLISPIINFEDENIVDRLFHEAVWVCVERHGLARRAYRVTAVSPEGGQEFPRTVEVTGVDAMEHLKHLPLWADPSNHSKVVQGQFQDIQDGSAEQVSRKLIGRNLIGYQQPGLLDNMFSWTGSYSTPSQWSNFQPSMHPVICSPKPSGIPSEWSVVAARWDNAWDLLKATWDAAGILATAEMWLPGDPQPFADYTMLNLPTIVVDFKPRATVSGAAGLLSQGWKQLERQISNDQMTSVTRFADTSIPTADGREPWVVFELEEAPRINIRKSTDHTFLVGGQSPKGLNDFLEVGVKSLVAAGVAMIPGIGAAAAELIKGGGELLGKLAADRFLNLNEHTDTHRRNHHGRFGFKSVFKAGQANSDDSIQKAWQAKTETDGGLSVAFELKDAWPYIEGRDFSLGDTAGIRAWGVTWGAYLSEHTWISTPGNRRGTQVALGNLTELKDMDELLAQNSETVRGVISRLSTFVEN